MATKKEMQLDELKSTMDKGTKLLEKISELNIDNSNKISYFKNHLSEIQDICLHAMDSKRLTIKYLKSKDTELNEEILKLNGYIIKNKELDLNNLEKGLFNAYIIPKKEYSPIKFFSSQYFELLKKDILKNINIEDIYFISCNEVMFKDIESFFVSSKEELDIKSIDSDGLHELRAFLIRYRDYQIQWFMQEKQERDIILKEFYEKYYYTNEHGERSFKQEYLSYYNKENHKEYELAEKYIDEDYWKERNIARVDIMNYIDNKSMQWIIYTFEEQRIKEFNKISKEIINLGGKILDIYDVRVGAKGELNFEADCENAIVSVKTVGAGGYNIQIFHYRTLVNVKKYKQSKSERANNTKSKLSKKQLDELNYFIPTIKELVLTAELSFEEGYVLNYMCRGSYRDIGHWYNFGCNPLEIDDFFEYNLFIKTKSELRKVVKSLCKKKYVESIKSKYGEDFYLGYKSTCVDGVLGFTKEDHDEIYERYDIKMTD